MLTALLLFVYFMPCNGAVSFDSLFGSALEARFAKRILVNENIKLMREANVRKLYINNRYTPLWIISNAPSTEALNLVNRLQQSRQEGLRPREYHVNVLNKLLSRTALRIQDTIDVELLLTDAFLAYADHLFNGRTRPIFSDPEWHIIRPDVLEVEDLIKQISPERSLNAILDDVAPQEEAYLRLRTALKSYLAIKDSGGWQWKRQARTSRLGDVDKGVGRLKKLLILTGDLADDGQTGPSIFDEKISDGLRRFQLRHGLTSNGLIDGQTSKALSVSVDDRIIQIELNLERWRWLPRKLARPSIIVNAAEFGLEVFDEKGSALSMKVIIGQQFRRTPVFEGQIEAVILNPKWIVPDRIAIEDLLPLIKRNSRILQKKGIRVYRWKGRNLIELNPKKIQWKWITPDNFNFQLVQDAGPENVQGRIKFVFPNNFGIYIHDTPIKTLFDRKLRTYSSGCIRVENASKLAEHILKNLEGKNWEEIQTATENGSTIEIPVIKKLPVYTLYWTAWVGKDNLLQFRDDIYGRDALLRSVLAY